MACNPGPSRRWRAASSNPSTTLSPSSARSAARGAFTLVELLVVIGIIALLVSILLPTLAGARQRAQTVTCLSNLRQIGIGHQGYLSDFKGQVVPMDYLDTTTPPSANGYSTVESWATILVAYKYLPSPFNATGQPNSQPSVFKCPSGNNDVLGSSNVTNGLPASRTDGEGTKGVDFTSKFFDTTIKVDCWYGINGTSGWNYEVPSRRWPGDPPAPSGRSPALCKITEIHKPTELAFIFDGLGGNIQTTNANRINARHNKSTSRISFSSTATAKRSRQQTSPAGSATRTSGARRPTLSRLPI